MKTAAALMFVFLCSAAARAQQGKPPALPDDEESLLRVADERLNNGMSLEAEQAYRRFLEKFPSSPKAAEAEAGLARSMVQRGEYEEARRLFARLFEKYPKAEHYWESRLAAAGSWQAQGLWGRAVDAYRDIANEAKVPEFRKQAVLAIWSMTGKQLSLQVSQTFTTGQNPEVGLYAVGLPKVAMRAYRIKYEAVLPHLSEIYGTNIEGGLDKVPAAARTLLKEWTESFQQDLTSRNVVIPFDESGIYVVEAEAEGVIQTVTALVGRYGIIAKTAAEKLVCFVQDRVTSRPVEGASIRVQKGDRHFLGSTDARGLFVTKGYLGGVIVGQHDGELFLAEPRVYGLELADPVVYIVTDRPIYRPNQTVRFRVVHRDERGRELAPRPGQKVLVRICYQYSNEVYRKSLVLNDYGSAEGEFALGDSPYLGEYTVRCSPEAKGGQADEESWDYSSWSGYGSNLGTFRVDEYRKPEFKVQVDFKKPIYVKGDAVEASGKAQYFFGGPVAKAEFRYYVYFRRSWSYWSSWAWYYDWYFDDDEESGGRPRAGDWIGDEVASGLGETDKDGKFSVNFGALIEREEDGVYTAVVQVTDLSRRMASGAGSCKGAKSELSLATTLNKYVYKTGDPILVKVRATSIDEKPAPGTKILLRGYDQLWNGTEYTRKQIYEGTAVTDAQGIAEFTCTPGLPQGYLVLEAEAHDAKNRRASADAYAWLSGSNGWNDLGNWNDLDIVLDKKAYEVGETARIFVSSRHKNITLLCTIEGSEIYHHEVVSLKGHTALLEFVVDRADLAPNVLVSFIGLRDREVVQSSKSLVVNPSKRFVTVEIKADQAEYRPRQKARYEIRTSGADGKPVSAEVMLGIVDDAIYALQEEYAPDIRKRFIHRRPTEVATSTSLHYTDTSYYRGGGNGPLTGATFALEESVGLLVGDEEGKSGAKAFAATEIRSKFADTMLWRTLVTDAQGRASLEVDLADNVTTWRTTARAHTIDSRFGQETHSVLSRKNIIVRLETPRFLTQNDEGLLSAVVHNNFPVEKELKIEFAAEGLETQGDRTALVRIPAGGQKRFDWKSRARDVGIAKITAKALGTEDSDAMELPLPILPHGNPTREGKAGLIEGRVVEKLTLPANAIPNSAELTVTLSPVHASMVLDALDSLAGYPYGCVEQTMSRFMPTVAVSQALKKLGISKPKLEAELPLMVSSGLQRLRMLQQGEGAWGWWGRGQGSSWITAYVVSGLALAQEAGHAVPEDMLNSGMDALWGQVHAERDPNEAAYILSALSAGAALKWEGNPDLQGVYVSTERQDRTKERQELIERLVRELPKMKPYALALMAIVLQREGKDPKEAMTLLSKGIKDLGTHARVEDSPGWGWMDDGAEASAVALRAFLRVDPKNPMVPKLANGLSLARRGPWWTSTRQTAMAVFALVDYLALTGELNPDMTLTLTINGERISSERVTKETWAKFDGVRKFPTSRLKPGENVIEIERTGTGTPSYTIALQYHLPAENIAASKGGLRVDRRYSRIHHEGGERVLVALREGEAVPSGEEIEVTLSLTADEPYEWLMLEDPLPAGFEPVREYWGHYGWLWDYWYDHKEFHDQRVSVAMSWLGKEGRTVSYTMRAETPGDFHALPARVFNMYHPEVGGHSAESRIKVVERN